MKSVQQTQRSVNTPVTTAGTATILDISDDRRSLTRLLICLTGSLLDAAHIDMICHFWLNLFDTSGLDERGR